MMIPVLPRLSYRMQIPLGLAMAVTLSVVLVSIVAARISARTARQESVATVQRVMDVLGAQGRPLLAAEDTWHAFALVRNTAALLPDADKGHARAAILDADGRFLAGSDPKRLPTGDQALGVSVHGRMLPPAKGLAAPRTLDAADGSMSFVQPIRSEDDKVIGFVLAEVDAAAFAPDWAALSMPGLIGAALAVIILVPTGWFAGRRMAQPVGQMAGCIAQIGRIDLRTLQGMVPQVNDPELGRIAGAVRHLLAEMSVRQANEQRALAAERLAAIGRMTAAVAHEINNPLAGLLTAIRTLRLQGDVAETRVRTVNLIDRGLQQIRTMTAALLPQARVQDRCLIPSDLEDVTTLARAAAALHSVTLTSVLEQQDELRVPSSAFRQVTSNLLLNAIKAAAPGGQVHAVLSSDAQSVRLVVTNTGQVMSADDLEHRLHTEDPNDPNGFGLWICREFAVRHGGGFDAAQPGSVPAPYSTRLSFWLPNRIQS